MKRILSFAERGFMVLSIFIFTANLPILIQLAGQDQGYQEVNNPLQQILTFGIYGISFLLLVTRWKQTFLRLITKDKLIWLVLLIVFASTFWSPYPGITLRRSIALLGTTFFGVYLAVRYSLRQQLELLSCGFGLTVFLSFVFGIALPQYGVMFVPPHEGAWRGVFIHKNGLGSAMALSALLFLILFISGGKGKWIKGISCALSILLLLLSSAKTALLIFLILLILLPLYRALRWHYNLLIPFFIILIVTCGGISIFLIENYESLLRLIGKDPTLTGRLDMWPYIWEMIEKHPWLGYGYEGFWRGEGSAADYIWSYFEWKPSHSHNGLLELLLTFGILGTFIYLLNFLIVFRRSLTLVRLTRSSENLWPVIFLTFLLLLNIAEKQVLGYNNIFWVIYVALILSEFNSSKAIQSGYKVLKYESLKLP